MLEKKKTTKLLTMQLSKYCLCKSLHVHYNMSIVLEQVTSSDCEVGLKMQILHQNIAS